MLKFEVRGSGFGVRGSGFGVRGLLSLIVTVGLNFEPRTLNPELRTPNTELHIPFSPTFAAFKGV